MITESLTLLTTQDNEQVAVWRVADTDNKDNDSDHISNSINNDHTTETHGVSLQQNTSKNILLLHGAFSDKRIHLGIAHYLAEHGYHCYIMEWRGHGNSPKSKKEYNLETIALNDVAATFDYLFNELNLPAIHCITHSGGGMCLTMCLLQNKNYINKVKSISLFACQAYGAASTPKAFTKVLLSKTMTLTLGYLPAIRMKLGPINESYYTMKQWFNWNLGKNFYSTDGKFDYRQHMHQMTMPIYSIAATGDDFVAPPSGCLLYLNDYQNPNNQFREFGIDNGDLDNYSHSRVLMSRNSAKEIWPTVLAWIEKHNQ